MNRAFVFIKPHAVTESVKELVKKGLAAKGVKVSDQSWRKAWSSRNGYIQLRLVFLFFEMGLPTWRLGRNLEVVA
jgi:hypothetical protein